MATAGAEHGDLSIEIAFLIKSYLRGKDLGKVYGADTGFTIAHDPDTVRAPDVGFVRKDRLPVGVLRRFFPGPPDLAVEVVSPADRHTAVLEKVDAWLTAGTVSVWVVDPPRRGIDVYRAGGQVVRYRGGDELRDEPTLPGFVMKLDDLFDVGRA